MNFLFKNECINIITIYLFLKYKKFNYICTHCGCRRPTSSARRQWAAALVAEDVEHVDHAADEVYE